jgi:hypothetical protein
MPRNLDRDRDALRVAQQILVGAAFGVTSR